jgi:hypothetical protein
MQLDGSLAAAKLDAASIGGGGIQGVLQLHAEGFVKITITAPSG